MTEQERGLLLDLAGEVAVLKTDIAALNELLIALAVALTQKPGATLREVGGTLALLRVLTRWIKGEATADGMAYVTDSITALAGVDPLLAQLTRASMYRQAGDSLRAPLHTWLSQAAPDEIEADVRNALLQLLAELAAQKGGSGSPDGA